MWPSPSTPGDWVLWAGVGLAMAAYLALREYRPPRNRPLTAEPLAPERPGSVGDPQTLVLLALSGGGTRAAAFAWRVLAELEKIHYSYDRDGVAHRTSLADEIALISAISGGSFAAVGWSLFRDRPEVFRRRFLQSDVERRLTRGLFWPPRRWAGAVAPHYNRIHVAAEIYDREIFDGKTLGDLPAVPELRLHATNLTMGTRFTFRPTDFGHIGSDWASYPVGYACAACSAFPVLLSPLTLQNYSRPLPRSELEKDIRYFVAKANARDDIEFDIYCRLREFYNEAGNRYVHLSDGGLVDNQGLQAILDEWEVGGVIHRALYPGDGEPLRRLVIINVNAGTIPDDSSGRHSEPPGIGSVIKYTMVTSMDVLSAKRWMQNKDLIANFYDEQDETQALEKPYAIEVSFRNLADEDLRRECNRIPTSFHLEPRELALIDEVAPRLLEEDPEMRRLRASLEAAAPRAPGG